MKMHQMKGLKQRAQAGFTLIELVVVIVILGILAATALPRFFDLTTDARKAAVAGVAGGFTTGVAMSHAKWLVDGSSIGTCSLVTAATATDPAVFSGCAAAPTAVIEGVVITFNALGYPTNIGTATLGSTTGLLATSDTTCLNVWEAVLSTNRPTTTTDAVANPTTGTFAGGFDWAAKTTDTNTTCTFTYFGGAKTKTARNFVYTPATGAIVLNNL